MPARTLLASRRSRLAVVVAVGTAVAAGTLGLALPGAGSPGAADGPVPVAAAVTSPPPMRTTASASPTPGGAPPAPASSAPAARPSPEPSGTASGPAVLPSTTPTPASAPNAVHTELIAPSPETPSGLPIDARIGFPAEKFGAGGGPAEFSVVLTNRTAETHSSLTPMLQLVPSSRGPFTGALEQFDPAAHDWRPAASPEPDTAPIGATGPTPFAVPAGGSLTIRYRLTLPPDRPLQRTDLLFYAIGPGGKQVSVATGVLPAAAA